MIFLAVTVLAVVSFLAIRHLMPTDRQVIKVIRADFPENENPSISLLVKETEAGHVEQITCAFPYGSDSNRLFAARTIRIATNSGKSLCTVLTIDDAAYKERLRRITYLESDWVDVPAIEAQDPKVIKKVANSKPPFDPNKPFHIVADQLKPPFDPDKYLREKEMTNRKKRVVPVVETQ